MEGSCRPQSSGSRQAGARLFKSASSYNTPVIAMQGDGATYVAIMQTVVHAATLDDLVNCPRGTRLPAVFMDSSLHPKQDIDACGRWNSTILKCYGTDCSKFTKAGRAFILPNLLEGDVWLVPIADFDVVLSTPEAILSFREHQADRYEVAYTTVSDVSSGSLYEHFLDSIRGELTRRLGKDTAAMIDEADAALTQYWGSGQDHWTEVDLTDSIKRITSRIGQRTLVGLPLCKSPWQSNDSFSNRTDDFLQNLITSAFRKTNEREQEPRNLAFRIMMLDFAAVHTTSTATTNALLDLISGPQEEYFWDEIVDGARSISASCKQKWTKNDIDALEKHDSAIKESMRLHGFDALGPHRRVTQKDGITLPSGLKFGYGATLGVPLYGIHHDNNIYPEANQYRPFRFYTPKSACDDQIPAGPPHESAETQQSSRKRSLMMPLSLAIVYKQKAKLTTAKAHTCIVDDGIALVDCLSTRTSIWGSRLHSSTSSEQPEFASPASLPQRRYQIRRQALPGHKNWRLKRRQHYVPFLVDSTLRQPVIRHSLVASPLFLLQAAKSSLFTACHFGITLFRVACQCLGSLSRFQEQPTWMFWHEGRHRQPHQSGIKDIHIDLVRGHFALSALGIFDHANEVPQEDAPRSDVERPDPVLPTWNLRVDGQEGWRPAVAPVEDDDIGDEEGEEHELEDQPGKHDFLSRGIRAGTASSLQADSCQLADERDQIAEHEQGRRGARRHERVVASVQCVNRPAERHVDRCGDHGRSTDDHEGLKGPGAEVVRIVPCPGSPIIAEGFHCSRVLGMNLTLRPKRGRLTDPAYHERYEECGAHWEDEDEVGDRRDSEQDDERPGRGNGGIVGVVVGTNDRAIGRSDQSDALGGHGCSDNRLGC
nr:cytochrome p450 monooxygenase tenb [Quercus suber]